MGNSFQSSQGLQTITESSRENSALKNPIGNSVEYEMLVTKNIDLNPRIVSHDIRSTTYTVEQNHNSSRKDTVNPTTNVSVMNSSILSKKQVSHAVEEADMWNSFSSQFNQKMPPPLPISKRKEPTFSENDSFDIHKRSAKETRVTPREEKQHYSDGSGTRSDKSQLGSKSNKNLEYMNNISTSDFYAGPAVEISKNSLISSF